MPRRNPHGRSFRAGRQLADTEWDGHIRAIIRVNRDVLTRSATTGLWRDSSETALFVSDVMLPAAQCAKAIREHWHIENRSHYVRDGSFAEDASRIRCNPGIFARLRSFSSYLFGRLSYTLDKIDQNLLGLNQTFGMNFVSRIRHGNNDTVTLECSMLASFGGDPGFFIQDPAACLVHQHRQGIINVPLGRLFKHHALLSITQFRRLLLWPYRMGASTD